MYNTVNAAPLKLLLAVVLRLGKWGILPISGGPTKLVGDRVGAHNVFLQSRNCQIALLAFSARKKKRIKKRVLLMDVYFDVYITPLM